MDSIWSVQSNIFTRDGIFFLKKSWSRRKHRKLYTQTTRWNLGKQSPNFNTSSIRDKWHRWKTRRRAKEGTSAVLLQSGLDEKWWAECNSCMRNVQDLLADGKTLCERRHGEPFKGRVVPFGAMVEYHPISTWDQARIQQFGKKVLPGIFPRLCADRGRNLEKRYYCRSHWGARSLNAREVWTPRRGEHFQLPDSRWTGFTKFTLLKEKPPKGYLWSGEGLTKIQTTARPDHVCPEVWTKIGEAA